MPPYPTVLVLFPATIRDGIENSALIVLLLLHNSNSTMSFLHEESSALSSLNTNSFQDNADVLYSQSSQPDLHSTIVPSISTGTAQRVRTSWVWQHNKNPILINEQNGQCIWQCLYCTKRYKGTGGTAAPTKHLMDVH